MCWASSTAHSWKSINSAGEQGEEKRGKTGRGGGWETRSEGLGSHTWGRKELLTSTPLSGLPAPQPCPAPAPCSPSTSLLVLSRAGKAQSEADVCGEERGSLPCHANDLYLMTHLPLEVTKQPPHVSCPQDTSSRSPLLAQTSG